MIAGSRNRLNRNGRTAFRLSGPPRLNSTTATRLMTEQFLPFGGGGAKRRRGSAPKLQFARRAARGAIPRLEPTPSFGLADSSPEGEQLGWRASRPRHLSDPLARD